jgi:hypothetical protein
MRLKFREPPLWSENDAAGTTHPAHNNEYYCTLVRREIGKE